MRLISLKPLYFAEVFLLQILYYNMNDYLRKELDSIMRDKLGITLDRLENKFLKDCQKGLEINVIR
jgi:hypothetical protein